MFGGVDEDVESVIWTTNSSLRAGVNISDS